MGASGGSCSKRTGKGGEEIAELLERQTEESKDFAYALAEEIKNELLAADAKPGTLSADDEDRQRQLFNDDTVAPQTEFPQTA